MLQKKASKPVLYVIAYNPEGLIKDVTRRYCPQWISITRKQRIDEKWWTETLSYWLERATPMSKQEDELFLQKCISLFVLVARFYIFTFGVSVILLPERQRTIAIAVSKAEHKFPQGTGTAVAEDHQ